MVTGGAGFIGSHLVDRIIRENPEKVIVVDNFFLGNQNNLKYVTEKLGDRFKLYYQDAGHYEKMKNIFEIEKPNVVFNLAVVPLLASHILPKITCEDNIQITLSVLELLRKGLYDTLVHCSSSEVYGTSVKDVMDENHPLNPTTPYAASKASCDLLVQSYTNTFDLDTTIVRPFNNYGPRQNEGSYAGVIPITCKRIMNGEQPVVHGDGLQTRDYIFVKDTVEGFIKVYNNPQSRDRVISLCTGEEITILDIVKYIVKYMEYEGEIRFDKIRVADVRRHCGDTTSMRSVGFNTNTKFEEGIKETIGWYQKETN